jgi:hypothetical protein
VESSSPFVEAILQLVAIALCVEDQRGQPKPRHVTLAHAELELHSLPHKPLDFEKAIYD